ncbi:ABC transporter ATP-binding protein [Hyphobacterium sp.]|uniref:ABC transporter ATP-binding protein n=1 Tax=Hyphobacterium sp. TaxID=2004662 RepID=UPI003BA90937
MADATATTDWTLELDQLCHFYGKQRETPSVKFPERHVFRPGEITVLVGESGSGKSTLLKMIGGLDFPRDGSVVVRWDICLDPNDQRDKAITKRLPRRHDWLAHYRRHRVAFLFQDGGLLEEFSVLQNVMLPLRYAEIPRSERLKRCRDALIRVGLGDKIERQLHQLSGGERHRVAMARTIAREAAIVVCDEPTAALDKENALLVRDILKDEAKRGACVFIATHDARLMKPGFVDHTITVTEGAASLTSHRRKLSKRARR